MKRVFWYSSSTPSMNRTAIQKEQIVSGVSRAEGKVRIIQTNTGSTNVLYIDPLGTTNDLCVFHNNNFFVCRGGSDEEIGANDQKLTFKGKELPIVQPKGIMEQQELKANITEIAIPQQLVAIRQLNGLHRTPYPHMEADQAFLNTFNVQVVDGILTFTCANSCGYNVTQKPVVTLYLNQRATPCFI